MRNSPEELALWRDRVETARASYERAKVEAQLALEQCRKGEILASDGTLNFSQAALRENLALAEYMRLVKAFAALVLDERPQRREL